MRVAVAGATGNVGVQVVAALSETGHEPVRISRSSGVDLMTGEGLDATLAGAGALIDVTNVPADDPEEARQRFGTMTRNLLQAGRRVGLGHHVLLSILNIDKVEGIAHHAGKRAQEQLVRESGAPATIVRAAQFFDFPETVVSWTREDGSAIVPPLLMQPIAVSDLARVLADVAVAGPAQEIVEVAGPEPQDLVDMARRSFAARGEHLRLVPSWRGPLGIDFAGEVLMPNERTRLTKRTFDDWLAERAAAA